MPTEFKFFISYARADKKLAQRFYALLIVQLGITEGFVFEPWRDDMIELGADWEDEIQQAIQACDFGLLLISPNFLNSEYIKHKELSHFVATLSNGKAAIKKPVVPVLLKPVDIGRTDMQGLEQLQIFHDDDGKSFSQRRTPRDEAFVDQLVAKMMQKFQ